MADDELEADIRAAQEAAANSGDAPASPDISGTGDAQVAPSPASVPDAPATDGERARDEAGKFKAKTPDAPKPADAAAPVVATAAVPAQPEVPPPLNWKGAGKVDWKRLPKAVQQEISQEYTRSTESNARLQKLDAVLTPDRVQQLSAAYGSVEQGLQAHLAISDMATKNPTGFILWFAQQRGVNLAQMVNQASQQQGGTEMQPAMPQADPVAQRLAQLETMIQGFTQQQQQQTTAPVLSEIDRFSADPANPYFNDVQDDILALLKGGRVLGASPSEKLKNAYDMAVWAHPEIRKTLIESQQKNFADQQASVANTALNASSSISGSPAGAKIAEQEPNETLEQTITRLVMASRS